ncbi:zinc ribbon domain-containing protein [Streptomyces sp. NPDC007189]|uniref:zinc ribbon domain-containing protein n=1 Tax=Streptomyces sp. NPDC007189 TaxID=3154315 RepID=UPI003451B269
MGRTHNTRLSQTVRGQITDRMRHLAAEVGIAVVTVPARNTSKHCPHCLTPLRHRKAPDRPTVSGWKWAICPNPECGWQGDRDQGAWQRIAARGLTHQTKTIVDHFTGQMVIRAVVETMEAKAVLTAVPKTSRTDRSKTGPGVCVPRNAFNRRGPDWTASVALPAPRLRRERRGHTPSPSRPPRARNRPLCPSPAASAPHRPGLRGHYPPAPPTGAAATAGTPSPPPRTCLPCTRTGPAAQRRGATAAARTRATAAPADPPTHRTGPATPPTTLARRRDVCWAP